MFFVPTSETHVKPELLQILPMFWAEAFSKLVFFFLFILFCLRRYLHCSWKSVHDILQCLQFAAAYFLTHLYILTKTLRPVEFSGGEKRVAAAFA